MTSKPVAAHVEGITWRAAHNQISDSSRLDMPSQWPLSLPRCTRRRAFFPRPFMVAVPCVSTYAGALRASPRRLRTGSAGTAICHPAVVGRFHRPHDRRVAHRIGENDASAFSTNEALACSSSSARLYTRRQRSSSEGRDELTKNSADHCHSRHRPDRHDFRLRK